MTEATEAARVTLAQLNEKLAEFDRRAIELENEATGISLAAMTGDAAARKRLDALNRERSAHELESRNIKSAIRAQEAVVAEAERAEKDAENAEKAKRALIVSESSCGARQEARSSAPDASHGSRGPGGGPVRA